MRVWFIKVQCIAVCIYLFGITLCANTDQPTRQLIIRVTDSDGHAIENATVTVSSLQYIFDLSVIADHIDKGDYRAAVPNKMLDNQIIIDIHTDNHQYGRTFRFWQGETRIQVTFNLNPSPEIHERPESKFDTSVLTHKQEITPISHVRNYSRYYNTPLWIKGFITRTVDVPFTSNDLYKVTDGTAELWVLSNTGLPPSGREVAVRGRLVNVGTLFENIEVGGMIFIQERIKVLR